MRRLIAEGEVLTTVSGAVTTPFPRVDVTTEGRTRNTVKRVNAWLIENARVEASARGLLFPIPAKPPWSQADKDSAEIILLG